MDLIGCHPKASWLLYPVLQNVSRVRFAVGKDEWRGHDSHGFRNLIHLIVISCPEGCKHSPIDTTQGHDLVVNVRDNAMIHVCAWECGVSTRNPVQAGLANVHVHLSVFEVFPKSSYKCFINLFPLQFYALV